MDNLDECILAASMYAVAYLPVSCDRTFGIDVANKATRRMKPVDFMRRIGLPDVEG